MNEATSPIFMNKHIISHPDQTIYQHMLFYFFLHEIESLLWVNRFDIHILYWISNFDRFIFKYIPYINIQIILHRNKPKRSRNCIHVHAWWMKRFDVAPSHNLSIKVSVSIETRWVGSIVVNHNVISGKLCFRFKQLFTMTSVCMHNCSNVDALDWKMRGKCDTEPAKHLKKIKMTEKNQKETECARILSTSFVHVVRLYYEFTGKSYSKSSCLRFFLVPFILLFNCLESICREQQLDKICSNQIKQPLEVGKKESERHAFPFTKDLYVRRYDCRSYSCQIISPSLPLLLNSEKTFFTKAEKSDDEQKKN